MYVCMYVYIIYTSLRFSKFLIIYYKFCMSTFLLNFLTSCSNLNCLFSLPIYIDNYIQLTVDCTPGLASLLVDFHVFFSFRSFFFLLKFVLINFRGKEDKFLNLCMSEMISLICHHIYLTVW